MCRDKHGVERAGSRLSIRESQFAEQGDGQLAELTCAIPEVLIAQSIPPPETVCARSWSRSLQVSEANYGDQVKQKFVKCMGRVTARGFSR